MIGDKCPASPASHLALAPLNSSPLLLGRAASSALPSPAQDTHGCGGKGSPKGLRLTLPSGWHCPALCPPAALPCHWTWSLGVVPQDHTQRLALGTSRPSLHQALQHRFCPVPEWPLLALDSAWPQELSLPFILPAPGGVHHLVLFLLLLP